MKKILMIVSMSLMVNMLQAKTKGFDWNPVMDAIIQVESGGDTKAVSGNSVGAMQITPILVEDCNLILQKLHVERPLQCREVKRNVPADSKVL